MTSPAVSGVISEICSRLEALPPSTDSQGHYFDFELFLQPHSSNVQHGKAGRGLWASPQIAVDADDLADFELFPD